MLMTEHNLWFYQRLMQGLRDAIGEQRSPPTPRRSSTAIARESG